MLNFMKLISKKGKRDTLADSTSPSFLSEYGKWTGKTKNSNT
jgi:hypothetical protein